MPASARIVPCSLLIALLFAMATPPTAHAQHAGFVVFGEPNEAGANAPAEHRFVHPVTAPYFHEDSFVTTDVRAWYVYHDFPKASAIGGGHTDVAALQVRVALLDNLQFVAYKDGFATFNSGAVSADGFMDIGAGVKWSFLQDWENQFHAAVGVGYEIKAGSGTVLQNDEEFRLWGSVNKGFDRLHLGGTVNLFLAPDDRAPLGDSHHVSWHLHADYRVCDWFSPVVELNGYHILDEGTIALPFSGVDVANLGGNKSEDVVTIGIGAEFRPMDQLQIRAAYETSLTDQNDLFGWRWTLSLIWSF